MTKAQKWAGWVTVFVLTWLVATVAGLLVFAPRTPVIVDERPPAAPVTSPPAGPRR